MKILIIDDEELKLIYFRTQCENIFNCPEIEVCSTLESANMQLPIFYDIVLCDLKLGNDYAESFVLAYKDQWPKSHVVLYSGNNESKEDIRGIKIWSSSSVVSGLEDYRRQKKLPKKEPTEIRAITIAGKEDIGPMRTYVQVIGIAFTVVSVSVGIGVTKNIIDSTNAWCKEHEKVDITRDKETSDALAKANLTNERLLVLVEQLNKTCDELKTEMRRAR